MNRILTSSILIGLLAAGCGKKEPVMVWRPLGADAPAFGSTPSMQNWAGFLPGRWSLNEMGGSGLGNKGNWKEVAKPGEEDLGDHFEFVADGTFMLQYGPYPVGGTWRATGKTVALQYTTLNGKPFQAALGEIRDNASSGRQGAIADDIFVDRLTNAVPKMGELTLGTDAKSLIFVNNASSGNPETDRMLAGFTPSLVRLGATAQR